MMERLAAIPPSLRAAPLLAAGAAALAALGGCDAKDSEGNLINGKKLFVQKCGSCHVLARANAKGTTGPNLDQAFQRALRDGFRRDTIESITWKQILYPNINGPMPAKLVTGQDAEDVAAYVAYAAARPGKDTGPLATAVGAQQRPLATARNGVLDIPADPNGQLLFTFKNAQSPPGPLTVNSRNAASVPHNIAVRGAGVSATGPVIQGGATSTVKVTVRTGRYEFLCTVPGHAQAGMRGTLTVR
jgi:mono/diheme cytochrome c family protein